MARVLPRFNLPCVYRYLLILVLVVGVCHLLKSWAVTADILLLPGCAGSAGYDPAFEYPVEIIPDPVMVNAFFLQRAAGTGKKFFQQNFPDRRSFSSCPYDSGIKPVFGCHVEVFSCIFKGYVCFRRFFLFEQRVHRSVEKENIRCDIGDGGASGWNTVFDSQMRGSRIVQADQRAIPPPDGAVMKSQMVQPVEIFIEYLRKKYGKTVEIFKKYLSQGVAYITTSKCYSGDNPAVFVAEARQFHRLLEKRYSGFTPEFPAEKKRRVCSDCNHGG